MKKVFTIIAILCLGCSSTLAQTLYLGHPISEITDSGKDVLAAEVIQKGLLHFEGMKGILPPIEKGRYYFLSGPAAWHGLIVHTSGAVYPQETFANRKPAILYSPVEEDADAAAAKISQELLDGWIPVLTTYYHWADRTMTTRYFTEYGDPVLQPKLWVEVKKSGEERQCYVVGESRAGKKRKISVEEFDKTAAITIAEWRKLAKNFDLYQLPFGEIKTTLLASMANLFSTFSGYQAHYGHGYYGMDINNNFPPSYLSAIEICYTLGMKEAAWGMASRVLRYGIDAEGHFYYRQGPQEQYAASGSEYGRFFWLVNRMYQSNPQEYPFERFADELTRMGDFLAGEIKDDGKGRHLLMMCPEADSWTRVHAYTNNNLWAIKGLKALGELLNKAGSEEHRKFTSIAEKLSVEVRKMLNEETLQSPYGPLVPFQSGYTPLPYTLSNCRDVPGTLPFENYFSVSNIESKREAEQDYTENTYANYRYYAEMLSSGLLRTDEANAIVKMRENLGGEILGMTRLWERLDDWPVDNYARFYLETDRLDKYLLLYYAHYLYHGNPDTGVYYEQVRFDGNGRAAADCVPSLLVTPLMTAWMFCFEPVADGEGIYLLRGIPAEWYASKKTISAQRLACTAGELSIAVTPSEKEVQVKIVTDKVFSGKAVYIDFHLDTPPALEQIRIKGGKLEKSDRPGRFRLYADEREVEIVIAAKK